MSINIVHCADLHIGAPCSYLPSALAAIRREELNKAFINIINFCKEKTVDALLICGDLFDCPTPTKKDCEFVRAALCTLSPIPVYIICGNHDYMCFGSPFSRENYFSDNVHIFPCFEHSFSIPEKNAVIHGISYSSSVISPSFENYSMDAEKINIMCLHGDMNDSSDYNTISGSTLSSLPVNYAAFGHIHNGEIFDTGNIKCAYCGTAEGHKFSDDGFTGFIYAQITPQETILSRISLSKRHCRNISIDISGLSNNEIVLLAKGKINSSDCFRLTLTGEIPEHSSVNTDYIKTQLSEHAFYLDVFDNTTMCYDFDAIEAEQSLRGEFLRELRGLCSGEEEFLLTAKAGLDALSGQTPQIDIMLKQV